MRKLSVAISLAIVAGVSRNLPAIVRIAPYHHQSNSSPAARLTNDQLILSFYGNIRIMGAPQDRYGNARSVAARLYKLGLRDLKNEVLERLAVRVMPTFLLPPEIKLSQIKFNYKLPDGTMINVDLKEHAGKRSGDGKPFDEHRGLVSAINAQHLFMAVGVEALIELPPDTRKAHKIKKNPNYHIFFHELGHAVYFGGLSDEERSDALYCMDFIKRPDLSVADEKEIKLEYFAHFFSRWFGTYPGGFPDYDQFLNSNLCMNQVFLKLFNEKGPFDKKYIPGQLGSGTPY